MTKLEQAARQALELLDELALADSGSDIKTTITALQEALAEQAEQEPVEQRSIIRFPYGICSYLDMNSNFAKRLLSDAYPIPKPDKSIRSEVSEEIAKFCEGQRNDIPATGEEFAAAIRAQYAAPVRTKDLTDCEIEAIDDANWENDHKTWDIKKFARSVIAADRALNNPSSDLL